MTVKPWKLAVFCVFAIPTFLFAVIMLSYSLLETLEWETGLLLLLPENVAAAILDATYAHSFMGIASIGCFALLMSLILKHRTIWLFIATFFLLLSMVFILPF